MILKDKVCIITGSSRGIGKAIALEFAKRGASLVWDAPLLMYQSVGRTLPPSTR